MDEEEEEEKAILEIPKIGEGSCVNTPEPGNLHMNLSLLFYRAAHIVQYLSAMCTVSLFKGDLQVVLLL